MRFLFFSFEMPSLIRDTNEISGGAAVQWRSWIRGFIDNGHEFGLLTYKGALDFVNNKMDFDVLECYDPKIGIKRIRVIYYQIPSLIKVIKKYNPDYIIQASAKTQTFILMLVAKFLKIPFIHRIASDVHVDERIKELVDKKLAVYLYRLGLKYSDYIIAQNNFQFIKLKETYPKKNIFIIHNPYVLETGESAILPREKRKYIAWIGNFRKIKNLPALANIARELPHVNFKIAGKEHADLDPETLESLSDLKEIKNVEFVGYIKQSEIKSFLAKSIALLNTSFTEGFSNTFLEAWSLGVPVITTKNVNPDEIVSKNNLGKVADDYNQLVDMIKIIMDYDEDEYDKLALHYHEYVREKHNPKMLAEKLVSYLTSIK